MSFLSKNKVKYLSSLKLKKFRDENQQFIAEGDKIVRDLLHNRNCEVILLAATAAWLRNNPGITPSAGEVLEASVEDLARISSFETPPPVIALLKIHQPVPDFSLIENSLSVALDSIQDPGNLGTIIRTADWFGIQNVFCNAGCADIYNPKVIQASMGAIFNIQVHFMEFDDLFRRLTVFEGYTIAGTYMKGDPVAGLKGIGRGMIIFGNESRGIDEAYAEFINRKVTIAAARPDRIHVESLNVASSVAAALALISETNINIH